MVGGARARTHARTHTHTHTHLFNGPFSGTTRVSRYQKSKTNLDFTVAIGRIYTVIHNYGNPYEKRNIFVARPHLWLQLGMVKPEIMLCETVLNLSTLSTLTYLRTY